MLTLGLAALLSLALLVPEGGFQPDTRTQALELDLGTNLDITDFVTDPVPEAHQWQEVRVQRGDTLGKILSNHGISPQAIHPFSGQDPDLRKVADLRVGDLLRLDIRDGELHAIERVISRAESLRTQWVENQWQTETVVRDLERRTRYTRGTIEGSLFVAGQTAGLSDRMIMQFANIFAWDIDFALDIRTGDTFQVLYEELYVEGEKFSDGNILAAEFINRDRVVQAFRYEDTQGDVHYLDATGKSLRRAFLRSPVEFSRISSRFNPNRRHPVLNTIRAHRGVDYAAPTGTPIRASGDGRVEFVGVRGGYGNTIMLRHGQAYTTLYAHLSRFARGIRTGTRVKQGQIIGYVGMTGLASGPHLHYEFQVNGVHRDPLTVALPKADGIPEGERRRFLIHVSKLKEQLAIYGETHELE